MVRPSGQLLTCWHLPSADSPPRPVRLAGLAQPAGVSSSDFRVSDLKVTVVAFDSKENWAFPWEYKERHRTPEEAHLMSLPILFWPNEPLAGILPASDT